MQSIKICFILAIALLVVEAAPRPDEEGLTLEQPIEEKKSSESSEGKETLNL